MTFRYFAYGSNLWEPWLRSRCPSASAVGTARLEGWTGVYDKPSVDGSAKLNIRPDPDGSIEGVVYEINDSERGALDLAEPLYSPILTEHGLTYTYEAEPSEALPYDWYVAVVAKGASEHGLRPISSLTSPDPLAPGIRPTGEEDLELMMSIMSKGLRSGGVRYYPHPGELGWWMYHWDERQPLTWWVQNEDAFAILDRKSPGEIFAFAKPGVSVWPLLDWSRRILGNAGEVAWVSDQDKEFEGELSKRGFEQTYSFISYEWNLEDRPIPQPFLPEGWTIRPVAGESEANARRSASHAAFESSMDSDRHFDRYVRFMRSPVYNSNRDLVVVNDEGRVASFMVWWLDDSGVAQIEPFGTDPDFQRLGLGRALIYRALADMKGAGMTIARVCTDEDREATSFYKGVGFDVVGALWNWDIPSPG